VMGMILVLRFVPFVEPAAAATCPADSVQSGTVCMDKYEASVWDLSAVPTNGKAKAKLIAVIQSGSVTLAELQNAGAVQLGLALNDLDAAGCPATGNGCVDVFAVSIPGVTPAGFITWFQAAAAARNSLKRLPTNQEWQVAALGTPDGGPCNVSSSGATSTGNAGCVSDVGAFDLVGNVWEWVADWVPQSTNCPVGWGQFSDDAMCLTGASITQGPGAFRRGGGWTSMLDAGVFAIVARDTPVGVFASTGFRGAR
jgi:Sulfatase-modifying factor enzyme 1